MTHFGVVKKVAIGLGALLALTSLLAGQTCAQLRELKGKTYGFHPAKLNAEEQKQRAKAMDEFWNAAKKSRDVACLATMLKDEPKGEFFLFDGASLLVEMAPTRDSAETAASAVARAELADVDVPGYISLALHLNRLGADTGPLAVKMVTAPQVSGFVPVHSLRVDRNVAAMFLFGSLSAEQNDKYLLPLMSSSNGDVRNTAVYLATASMTPASFDALKGVDRATLPKGLAVVLDSVLIKRTDPTPGPASYKREDVLHALAQFPGPDNPLESAQSKEMAQSAILNLTPDDVDAVRSARAGSFPSVSDESLYRFYYMTNLLISVINHLDLYADHRLPRTPSR